MRKLPAFLTLLALPASFAEVPRIYIANDDHTDYVWSGSVADYRAAFGRMIKYYLDRADATDNEPADFQARFNLDGSLWLWEYERNHASDFPRLIQRIQDGHISAPLTPITVCYGAQSAEGILRGMYYAGRIERRYHIRFLRAHPMEDQTMPYGLGSLFAGAGAQYCWMGICSCASRMADRNDPRKYEIYWWQANDKSKKILIKWNSMDLSVKREYGIGGYAEARFSKFSQPPGTPMYDLPLGPDEGPAAVVDYLRASPAFNAHWQFPLIKAAFGFGGDELETETKRFEDTARAKSSTDLRVVNSNEVDFFQDFEKTYAHAPDFPYYSAAFGNEWELYAASAAELTARVKRSVEKLRSAEALATLVSLKNPAFMQGRETERDAALMNMGLYFSHDWTGDRNDTWRAALGQWAKETAGQIEHYVDKLQSDASSALGNLIARSGRNRRFYVFNSLGWERTDIADFPYAGATPVHVIDLVTGQETPSQFDSQGKILRILASRVPSVGYKVFEIRSGPGQPFPTTISADAQSGALSNEYYSLKVGANGAITSLIQKAGNREFVKKIGDRAVNDLGPGSGTIALENVGPVSATLRIDKVPSPLQHTTRITLYRDSDRIDIRNEIRQNFSSQGDHPPAWAFSFDIRTPDIWHEEVGDIIHARLMPEGHYSRDHARYDWLTLNHFADMSGANAGVTLANSDCLFMKTGNSSLNSLDTATPQISVLVGGQVDGAKLGVYNQNGDSYFLQRFALRTHGAYDPVQAMRFGLEHQNPLVTGLVTGESPAYGEKSHSLLQISAPDVFLWALKPAEDGIAQSGIAMRVWNMSGSDVPFTVTLQGTRMASAKHATHIETPTSDATVTPQGLSATVPGHAIETYLMKTR